MRILPPAAEPVPIVIAGRSTAALRRTARLGDGWLGVWVSPDRFAQAARDIAAEAAARWAESHPVAAWSQALR